MKDLSLNFFGDRKSLTIKIGRFIQKIVGRKRIKLQLYDGYKSQIYFQR